MVTCDSLIHTTPRPPDRINIMLFYLKFTCCSVVGSRTRLFCPAPFTIVKAVRFHGYFGTYQKKSIAQLFGHANSSRPKTASCYVCENACGCLKSIVLRKCRYSYDILTDIVLLCTYNVEFKLWTKIIKLKTRH